MSAVFIIGKHIDSGLPLHVREAMNGLNCKCLCYACNDLLEAVQGSRDWYFRHSNKSNCLGNSETELHQYAKRILFENNSILTCKKRIDYTNPSKETVTDVYRSDVSATYIGKMLHFEVVVTSNLSLDKISHYTSNKINCIKIDLSDRSLFKATPQEIKNFVLLNNDSKSFIYWEEDNLDVRVVQNLLFETEYKSIPPPTGQNTSLTAWIFAVLIMITSIFFIKSCKLRKRRKTKSFSLF